MSPTDSFEEVDWTERTGAGRRPSWRFAGVVVSSLALGAAFAYDYVAVPDGERLVPAMEGLGLPGWDVAGIDWLFVASVLVVWWYLLYPLAADQRLARYYWRRIRRSRRGVLALVGVSVFYAVGIVGPLALDLLREFTGITAAQGPRGIAPLQPPLGFAVSTGVTNGICVGEVADGLCHGSLAHPLGTTGGLRDVLVVTVEGAQSAMQVATVVAVLSAPIGIAVGVTSAFAGGRVDALLMRYVDIQLVVPPFFVYLFLQVFVGRGFVLLVVVFGLLNWGSLARLVRSDALSKAELGYVLAAEDAGSGSLRTIRRHLLPNVSNTVVTGVSLMMPTVILVEVTLAFLQLSSPTQTSWGNLISGANVLGAGTVTIDGFDPTVWWTEAVPALALVCTVVAFGALGDALRDVLDPRTEADR